MTNQSTIDKLIEMRLTSMSDAFITQMEDPKMKDLSFEDRFGLLVDVEYNNRKSNSLKRLIKGAGFDQPEAYVAGINYSSGRKLNRKLIERLATCEYITDHRNLFITGATGYYPYVTRLFLFSHTLRNLYGHAPEISYAK